MPAGPLRVDGGAGRMSAFGRVLHCAVGRGGVVAAVAKTEGDGATPAGDWPIEAVLLRSDRIRLSDLPDLALSGLALPWRWLRAGDGWSDDPRDPAYNQPVSHPYRFSAEHLWRDDGAYDVIVVLGHNRAPAVAGRGSAIFWHLMHDDGRPTAGCIAISRADMLAILPRLQPGMSLSVS